MALKSFITDGETVLKLTKARKLPARHIRTRAGKLYYAGTGTNDIRDKTAEIDKRWDELKGMSKEKLLEVFSRSHKIHSATKDTPKSDLMNAIIESEIGWKHHKPEQIKEVDIQEAARKALDDAKLEYASTGTPAKVSRIIKQTMDYSGEKDYTRASDAVRLEIKRGRWETEDFEKSPPFKSEAQRRKFYAMKGRGEISPETVERREAHTPKGKKLPERV